MRSNLSATSKNNIVIPDLLYIITSNDEKWLKNERVYVFGGVHKQNGGFGWPGRPMHSRLSPDISRGDLATQRPHSSHAATSQTQAPRPLPVPLSIAVTSRAMIKRSRCENRRLSNAKTNELQVKIDLDSRIDWSVRWARRTRRFILRRGWKVRCHGGRD